MQIYVYISAPRSRSGQTLLLESWNQAHILSFTRIKSRQRGRLWCLICDTIYCWRSLMVSTSTPFFWNILGDDSAFETQRHTYRLSSFVLIVTLLNLRQNQLMSITNFRNFLKESEIAILHSDRPSTPNARNVISCSFWIRSITYDAKLAEHKFCLTHWHRKCPLGSGS